MGVAFPSNRSVWQRVPPGAWLLLAVGAAWYSLRDLGSLALSESPLAFVALVPVIAGWLLIRAGRRTRALRGYPDQYLLLLELTIAACLFLTALWVVVLLPTRLSWLYWLYRFDLLAVPLVVAGIILVLWGFAGLGALSRGVLYLILIWPAPHMLVHQTIGPALTDLSADFGRGLVQVLSLPYEITLVDPHRFTSTGAERFSLVIADTCAGLSALTGFLLAGGPVVLTWKGSWLARLTWLGSGAGLALASNLLRLGVLLVLSTIVGMETALGAVHTVLGIILFGLVFLLMVSLLPRFGLEPTEELPARDTTLLGLRPTAYGRRCVALTAICLVLGLAQPTLGQFAMLSGDWIPSAPRAESWTMLPALDGWRREVQEEIDWRNLYGHDSESFALRYETDEGSSSVIVQYVATPDQRLLFVFPPERRAVLRGESVLAVSSVGLGYGVTARMVDTRLGPETSSPGQLLSTLYWYAPVQLGDRLNYSRVALIADSSRLTEGALDLPIAEGPWLDGSGLGPARQRGDLSDGERRVLVHLDQHLTGFARQLVASMVKGHQIAQLPR